jgi:hypothetical protein
MPGQQHRGIWGASGQGPNARYSKPAAAADRPKRAADFPELAALELAFQQQQQPSGQQQQGTFDVQLLGANGVALPSGLRASIHEPHTLVPLRLGVAEGDCIGTAPGASPVTLALAAADAQMRPVAMALPPQLTAGGGAATAAADWPAASAHAADADADSSGDGGDRNGGGDAVDAGASRPDPVALSWAEQNPWLGADEDLTRLAYQVGCSEDKHTSPTSHLSRLVPREY